jgi:hypothetical protein
MEFHLRALKYLLIGDLFRLLNIYRHISDLVSLMLASFTFAQYGCITELYSSPL